MSRGTRALLDDIERYRQDLAAGVGLDTTSAADATREHAARMADLEARHRAWLAQYLQDVSGAASERPHTDVAQGQAGASTAGRNAPASSGPGPGQPNPHAAELAEAERLRQLPMTAYAEERQRLIRSSASNRGMFG